MDKQKTHDALAEWINQKLIEWINEDGEVKTVTDLANRIGVQRTLLSRWMSKNSDILPGKFNIAQLAKLGPEVYDILGLARPVSNPDLDFVNLNWERTPPTVRQSILASMKKAVGDERSPNTKRTVATPKPSAS